MDLRLQLAVVYASEYKWNAAIKQYAVLLDARPDSLEAYRGIAEAYKGQANYDAAIDYLTKALPYARSAADKIHTYKEIVRIDQVRVGEGNPLTSTGLNALIELAKLYLSRAETDKAIEALERIQMDNPEYMADEVKLLLDRARQ